MNTLVKAYVSRSALRHNARLVMGRTGVPLCAVVKANAYGHGTHVVVRALAGAGISFWGVAATEEALPLVEMKVRESILVMRPVGDYEADSAARERIEWMINNGIRATAANAQGLELLSLCATALQKKAYVHIKVDTGLGRNGCPHEEAEELVVKAARTPGIALEGLYSHFACSEQKDQQFSKEQLALFKGVTNALESRGTAIPIKHMANSAAAFSLPDSWMDMIRIGRVLYGLRGQYIPDSVDLIPAMRLVAPILMIKKIKKGRPCGYGATFVAGRDTAAGLLPLGYADGYSRRLSNAGVMEINGKQVPVIGRISMDFIMVDVTDVPDAGPGTEVCVISDNRKNPNSTEAIAEQLETVPHEVTSVLGTRVERVMVE